MKLDEIKDLIGLFDESNLSKIEIQRENFSIKLEKEIVAIAPTSASQAVVAPTVVQTVDTKTAIVQETDEVEGERLRSPMVGTYYASPSPDSPPFVKVGDTVKKGQVLAVLEAMKIMNELEAEYDCQILQALVNDGQPIEYDMPLFIVKRI